MFKNALYQRCVYKNEVLVRFPEAEFQETENANQSESVEKYTHTLHSKLDIIV